MLPTQAARPQETHNHQTSGAFSLSLSLQHLCLHALSEPVVVYRSSCCPLCATIFLLLRPKIKGEWDKTRVCWIRVGGKGGDRNIELVQAYLHPTSTYLQAEGLTCKVEADQEKERWALRRTNTGWAGQSSRLRDSQADQEKDNRFSSLKHWNMLNRSIFSLYSSIMSIHF